MPAKITPLFEDPAVLNIKVTQDLHESYNAGKLYPVCFSTFSRCSEFPGKVFKENFALLCNDVVNMVCRDLNGPSVNLNFIHGSLCRQ